MGGNETSLGWNRLLMGLFWLKWLHEGQKQIFSIFSEFEERTNYIIAVL